MNSIYYELTELALTSFSVGVVVTFCICLLVYVAFLKKDNVKNVVVKKAYNWADDEELAKKFVQKSKKPLSHGND